MTKDQSISATFAPISYTIRFNSNGGAGSMNDMAMSYDTAKNLTNNTFGRTGYTWTGWNTASDGSGTSYSNAQSVNNLTTADGGVVTLYAQWRANDYTVAFNANSGTGSMSDQAFKYDESKALSANAFGKIGYTFTGWNTAADGSGTAYSNSQVVSNLTSANGGKVTLYAQWKANPYSVVFDANGGSGEMADQQLTYDIAANLNANVFAKTGYTWKGWNTAADGSGQAFADEQAVMNLVSESGGKITLYAQWEANPYIIGFDANGGVGIIDDQQMIFDIADTLHDSAPLSREGYRWSHWASNRYGTGKTYKNLEEVINLTTEANAKVMLYSVWAANRYMIVYYANGGSGNPYTQSFAYDSAEKLDPNKFSRTGYKFVAWNTEADASGTTYQDRQEVVNLTKEHGASIALQAQWEPVDYQVVFDANSGSGSMEPQDLVYDTESELDKSAFEKPGYTFTGWNTSPDGSGDAYADQQAVMNLAASEGESIVLYAQWQANDYKIAYDANGGEGVMNDQSAKFDEELSLEPNSFSRAGYEFQGWSIIPGSAIAYTDMQQVMNLTTTPDATVTLYAVWSEDAPIAYNYLTTDPAHSAVSVDYEEVAPDTGIPSGSLISTDTGYIHRGWKDSTDNKVADSDYFQPKKGGSGLFEPNTFIAQVEPICYSVVFDPNGAEGTMPDQDFIYDQSSPLDPSAFSKEGYELTGWNTSPDGSGMTFADEQVVSNLATEDGSKVTLYAQWEPIGYEIVYKPNGGAGDTVTQELVFDEVSAIERNPFSYIGFEFVGWNTRAHGSGTDYAPGQEIVNLASDAGEKIELYAQWKPREFTVTFNDGHGKTLSTEQVVYGDAATEPKVPGRNGETFAGWNAEFDHVTSDLLVTAQWDKAGNKISPAKIAKTVLGKGAYGKYAKTGADLIPLVAMTSILVGLAGASLILGRKLARRNS